MGGFSDARLVLRDAGHIPWMEDPDGIAADVRHLLFDG
jgi:pimeloyl-ACP methyl ester carboxylesterase